MSVLKNNLLWAAVCLVLAGIIWAYDKEYQKKKSEAAAYESTISDLDQEIQRSQIIMYDSISLYQAEVKNLQVSKNNMEDMYRELLKSTKLRAKDVGSVTGTSTLTHSVDTVVAEVDTFGGLRAKVEDDWTKIDVVVKKNRQTIIDYSFKDSLTIISVQKKHSILFGLIKWKSHEKTRVINHNPKSQIVGLKTVEVYQ